MAESLEAEHVVSGIGFSWERPDSTSTTLLL